MSREESFLERYWRLRQEANELYQRQMREITQRVTQQVNELMRRAIQKELDAMEDAIKRGDYIEAWHHQMRLEILLE